MAKRRRLTPARIGMWEEEAATPAPPIARVAGDASTVSALEEVTAELARARSEGRLVQALPLDAVDEGYLVRDRILADDEDLKALIDSIRARGQQTPIEVVALEGGRYGLISGWRRLAALRRLHTETGSESFGLVQALLRTPETASDAYVAMVEENEIRVGLTYFERARIALKAVEQGVFEDRRAALQGLFGSASRARRSKIGSFIPVVAALDGALRFPASLTERLGLRLAKAMEGSETLAQSLKQTLLREAPASLEAEQALISKALAPPPRPRGNRPGMRELRPGLSVRETAKGVTISGAALTPELKAQLLTWLETPR
ncbi:MAG: ParB/RepB/Spo0J family partition protein [Alterinioella nitratireducens]|uniref:ParB/RepB/Spo0J family partition protein n=1 Tax=Alterinioella nitratireducens TaxID=2735915 RepID=UPI004059696A